MIRIITLHLRHKWAVLRRDHLSALRHMEIIMALDFTALQAAANALVAQDKADEAAATTAGATAVAGAQAQIDAIAAELAAQVTPPAAPTAAGA